MWVPRSALLAITLIIALSIARAASPQTTLTAADAAAHDGFGRAIAISGDTMVVGAGGVQVGAPETPEGAAYVYVRSGTGWILQDVLRPLNLAPGALLRSGRTNSLAIAASGPVVVYAATDAGVVASSDGGATWTTLLNRGSTTSITVDPSNPSILYAVVQSQGLFKTTDGGITWTEKIVRATRIRDVREVIVDPHTPAILYTSESGTLFKSTDGGETWAARQPSGSSALVGALGLSPAEPSVLYAAVGDTPSQDAFVTKLTSAGALEWSSYFGGRGSELDAVVALGADMNLYLAGGTLSTDVPVVAPVQRPAGSTDIFIARIVSDSDGDGLADTWERQFGLDPTSSAGVNGAAGDSDGDGRSNLDEFRAGTHPRGFFTRYFAEGATGSFFRTRFAALNPGASPATALTRFLKTDGVDARRAFTVPASGHATIHSNPGVFGEATAEFAAVIESDVELVVDRTMSWDATGYGAHAETGLPAPAATWYLAEGATHSGFNLFYLLENPAASAAGIDITYLRPAPAAPIVKTYTIAAASRLNVWVDLEDDRLASTDVSAIIRSTNGVPIVVERAMYLDANGLTFGAGHVSAGVTEPATSWFFAEGATGTYFDEFILVANPGSTPAAVSARYLLPGGGTISRSYTVAPGSRFTIWVDREDPSLENTAVSVVLTSDVPIVAERAMWWPGPTATTWNEAHTSAGATVTGTKWAIAGARASSTAETYILIANTSSFEASVAVRLLFGDGTRAERTFAVAPESRFNVTLQDFTPLHMGSNDFGVIVESLGATPAQLVVERATYSSRVVLFSCGRFTCASYTPWAAGVNALATRLQ